ncbi:NAD(P)/FAD-dependent oxidoreductase [Yoonia sediminilitoris]|uniref:Glycine/D-amino acid oxidase-like deaminating enzyme n=1 Tax=Yoonia sediminilitoris TaxID=1286148 RepID=A0A2T6KPU3_9RHOB|nr:FAD-dependent oxidoreductase [Yoonia sediminilitoris]PUB18581.1 glycine/D-amino acid oxidase-like deaminating enzyme [Yoonia sediminilitoris]RCW98749.1 glycine/D-amino acid oxidase-like deaminating enzyme [Yoonia sediminilitoris]
MIDFLIIGGGIAGVSAAARLVELGSVVVLETEDQLAYHASGRSAAMFEESYGKPSTIALNAASKCFHVDADVLSPRGLMMVGNKDNAATFENDRTVMQLDLITMDEAVDFVPITCRKAVDRAAYHSEAWDIDTDKLLQTFAKMVRAKGGQINTKAGVSSISRITTGWEVNTRTTSYFARNLVNAAGAWVDNIAMMAGITPLGFSPKRRSMARMPAPGGHDVRQWPMLFGPGETWYAKPDAGALIVSPADEDKVEPHDAYPDEMTLAEGLMRYENNVTEPIVRLLASWAGLRTFAPDGTLVLGRDPVDDRFIWCAGQGGYGMQSSPAASQLLADIIAERQPELDAQTVAALSPARFSA